MDISAVMTYLEVNLIAALIAVGGGLLMLSVIVKGYDWIRGMLFERELEKEWREDVEAREREYD